MSFSSSSYGKKAEEPELDGAWTVDRRLCLTEDRSRVVEEDTPEARFLWAIPGEVVDRAEAVRLGAIKTEEVVELPKPPPPRKATARPAAAKAVTPEENK